MELQIGYDRSMMRRRLLRSTLAVTLLAAAACGGLDVEGQPGEPTPMRLVAGVPAVDVSVGDERRGRPLVLDTGSPRTVLSRHAFPSLGSGWQPRTLRGFGLQIRGLELGVAPLFSENGCAGYTPAGLLGADVLSRFSFGLDYERRRAYLLDAGDVPAAPFGRDTDPVESVRFSLLGGGSVRLQGVDEPGRAEASRIVVQVEVESRRVAAVVDTGAAVTVASSELLQSLGGSDRPHRCCVEVATVDGAAKAALTRLRSLRVGSTALRSVAAMKLGDSVFSRLADETGRDVQLLIGGNVLQHFASLFDYAARSWQLHHYRAPKRIRARPFVLPGLTLCKAGGKNRGAIVLDVFAGSDAADEGIEPGMVVLAIDDRQLDPLSEEQIQSLLRSKNAGETMTLLLQTTAQPARKRVLVEQLLPRYE